MTDVMHKPAFEPPPAPRPRRRPWYRQAYLIVPLVLFVVAAAAVTTTVLLIRNDSVNVNVSAPPPAATPLRVTATSALTGEPLAVQLELPDGTQLSVGENGTIAPDRVKPGDQVGVTAEGYVTAKAPVGPDRTITATLQPTFATVGNQLLHWVTDNKNDKITNWVLSPATGFQYEGLRYRTNPWQVNADVIGKEGITVHLAVGTGFAPSPATLKEMFGSSAQQFTIAGQPAWHGSIPDASDWFSSVWTRDPLEIIVTGQDLSTTDGILAKIVTAQPAS